MREIDTFEVSQEYLNAPSGHSSNPMNFNPQHIQNLKDGTASITFAYDPSHHVDGSKKRNAVTYIIETEQDHHRSMTDGQLEVLEKIFEQQQDVLASQAPPSKQAGSSKPWQPVDQTRTDVLRRQRQEQARMERPHGMRIPGQSNAAISVTKTKLSVGGSPLPRRTSMKQ